MRSGFGVRGSGALCVASLLTLLCISVFAAEARSDLSKLFDDWAYGSNPATSAD